MKKELTVLSLKELQELRHTVPPYHGKRYGPWRLDTEVLTLTHVEKGYELDLEEATTSGQVLDWLIQIYQKVWCDPECFAFLTAAVIELVDPQKYLCSFGCEKKLPRNHWKKLFPKP